MPNSKKIDENTNNIHHLKDRVEHTRTRPDNPLPKNPMAKHDTPLGKATKVRGKRKSKYNPHNGTAGRRAIRRRKAAAAEGRYSEATKFISSVCGKSVKEIMEEAHALNSFAPVFAVLNSLLCEAADDKFQSLYDILSTIYEDCGDVVGPVIAVLNDDEGQRKAREIVAEEAEFLRKHHNSDSLVWTEQIKDQKHNVIKFYAKAKIGEEEFNNALRDDNVIKKYYNSNI